MLTALLLLLTEHVTIGAGTIIFIVGAGIWVIGLVLGLRGSPPPSPPNAWTWSGIGLGLMLLGLGIALLFGW